MLVLKDIWQCHIESISSVSHLFSYFCLEIIQVLKLCNIFWACQEALALFMCETIQYCHLRRSVLYVCVWRCNRQLNGWSIPFSRFVVFQSWGYTLFLITRKMKLRKLWALIVWRLYTLTFELHSHTEKHLIMHWYTYI